MAIYNSHARLGILFAFKYPKAVYMTQVIPIFFLFISAINFAQEVDHTGTYYWEVNPTNAGKHTRTLTVNADGTFIFNRYREPDRLNPDSDIWGKGTWSSKGKYIYFTTDPETELDEKYTLNFTNTKGRWDARKNKLILYESDIFWLRRFTISKKAN